MSLVAHTSLCLSRCREPPAGLYQCTPMLGENLQESAPQRGHTAGLSLVIKQTPSLQSEQIPGGSRDPQAHSHTSPQRFLAFEMRPALAWSSPSPAFQPARSDLRPLLTVSVRSLPSSPRT